jgi:hypothetical protein
MRTLAGLAVAVAPLLASVSCYKPHLTGDVVSGATKGSPLVKILVTLTDKAGECDATIREDRVYVFRGSAIRWRVVNNCKSAIGKTLKFTQPKLTQKKGYDDAKDWNYRFCTAQIDALEPSDHVRNVLTCEVPDDVKPGLYKYNLEGAARKDPEIEVRKGG